MVENKQVKNEIMEGLLIAFPVLIGYLPSALAFGLLAKNNGLSFIDTILFSIMVYAGASQFMALDLLSAGVGYGSIILATFLLNLRHIMMSASLSVHFKEFEMRYLPLIAFGITDETFSVSSFNKEKISLPFILVFYILAHTTWWLGTAMGYLIGEVLPTSLQSSLSVGLYALFAALLFPEIKKSNQTLLLSGISAIIYILLFYSKIFASGWDIILGILISASIGIIVFKNDVEDIDMKGAEN
ncbi:MAG: AzlC family ABC transporter permease [Firmicutes bacterium]|nr:AzlC family ABC transporter permease [Bacillota bacterium]